MGFLQKLRQQNNLRHARFGTAHWNPMEWGCAIGGECGELLNKLKKYERQTTCDPLREDLIVEISDEMADVIIYMDILAGQLGISLERAIQRKFNKTSDKHGFPEKLSRGQGGAI